MSDIAVIVELDKGAQLPGYQTAGSSGADLKAFIDKPSTIHPGERVIITTGIRLQLPEGYEAQVRSRSGLAAKHGIACLNSPGTIDQDYRGEIKVILHNHGTEPYTIEPGDRIAQLVVSPVAKARFELITDLCIKEADNYKKNERGEGAFGSTGR